MTTPTNACKKFRNLRTKAKNVWQHGVRIDGYVALLPLSFLLGVNQFRGGRNQNSNTVI